MKGHSGKIFKRQNRHKWVNIVHHNIEDIIIAVKIRRVQIIISEYFKHLANFCKHSNLGKSDIGRFT